MSKVKSNGGSSDYYKVTIRTKDGEFEAEIQDVIYALAGGDFSMGNVIKGARRMYLASLGAGKEGTDMEYDSNKIKWFVDDFVWRNSKG